MKPLREYLSPESLDAHIRRSLDEDFGTGPEAGDHSSLAALDNDLHGIAQLKAKEPLVFAGVEVADRVLKAVSPALQATWMVADGDALEAIRCVRIPGATACRKRTDFHRRRS